AWCLLLTAGMADAGRPAWTTSRVTGSPEPPSPYLVERIFPEISFTKPLDFALEPGTDRWFILQEFGGLFCFDPQQSSQPTLVLDVSPVYDKRIRYYGVEFHPDYESNR